MPRGPSPASENVFLALVESLAVLKLYKYVYDIQRLVDPPIWNLLSRGKWKIRMWEAIAHKPLLFAVVSPWDPEERGVEWQDPVTLAIREGIKPTEVSEE